MDVPFSPPDITECEIAEVVDTLRSGWITTGPKTKQFEKEIAEYCGSPCAVCLNSGTAAMELTLRYFGIGPGDEVITSAYTYTASASVALHVGANLVLVDTSPGSFFMDLEALEQAITPKTKAIIPVDLAGIPCEYEKIFSIVESKKSIFSPSNERQAALGRILIMADAAHSFGAQRHEKKSGVIADVSCFSFHAVKNLTTAEGGAVTFNPKLPIDFEEVYKEFMLLSLHGQSKSAMEKMVSGTWEFDIVAPYYKCNMTDIHASIGLSQLRRYDKMLERRMELISVYSDLLSDDTVFSILPHKGSDFQSCGHLFILRLLPLALEQRNFVVSELFKNGIGVNVHFKPLPMFIAYKNMGFHIKDFPNSFIQYQNALSLPLHNLLTDEMAEYVATTLKDILGTFV